MTLNVLQQQTITKNNRTSIAQYRSIACAFVPLYGIDISFQSTTLSGSQSSSFSQLKSCLSSWGFSHWERFWKAHTLEMVKYNSIQKY